MYFNTVAYMYFFGVIFIISWLLRNTLALRHLVLFAGSLFFYSVWNPNYLPLILGAVWLTWESGRRIARSDSAREKKLWLFVGVCGSLSVLAFFKYGTFAVSSLEMFMRWLGYGGHLELGILRRIALPVGISFYVFQTLSYTIDVYRGKLEHEKSLLDYALYVSFFPQLVAGPIVRATDFLPQLKRPAILTDEQYAFGVTLILFGLFKKVVIADYIAINLVERVFDAPRMMSSLEVIAGIYGYTLQIYCDFSGYSDIAIGSAALLGFTLTKNFDAPFRSRNLSEFWRRWHISLSTWLRDYLYISLGGSRNNRAWKTSRNLMITMLLGGLWHGPSWNFVFWGLLHGVGLLITHPLGIKGAPGEGQSWIWSWLGIFFTFHFVVFAFIFFRAPNFDRAWLVLSQIGEFTFTAKNLPLTVLLAMGTGYFLHFTPDSWAVGLKKLYQKVPMYVQVAVLTGFALLLQKVATFDAVPFIHFRF
ncbi:MBOAT family protein [Myxococcota bacterium]|nr:MBOAT family protein [Myxococcota bacterium]MBU1537823.1 MBOAT family protein [Myxococcota bacterium]